MPISEVKKEQGHWLRVFLDTTTNEVHIEGNRAGLEYFSAVCSKVIGAPAGGNHWHLGEAFSTLESGSLDLIVCYREGKSGEIRTGKSVPGTAGTR